MAYQSSYNYHNRPIEVQGETFKSRIHAYNSGKMTKVTDPPRRSHGSDPTSAPFGGFQQRRGEGGFGKPIDSYSINLVQSAKPAQAAPTPEPAPTPAEYIAAQSAQQKAEIDNYFQEKLAEVEAAIPAPPRGPATAVDQGATVRDLQIASEGDNEAAQARSTRVGIGGAAQRRRRSSMLTIPTF